MSYDIFNFDGVILRDGVPLEPADLPEIDAVMGDPRWLSYWFEEADGWPKRQTRLIKRLKLIDLWFRIARPEIAKHFKK